MDPQLAAALADRYPLERELGRGGMATVYLARDLKHHRAVAVKVLRPELSALLGADRFLREIEIAAQFAHPHILPLFDSGDADGHLYYVMPYIEGESLRARLVRERQLPVEEALRLAWEVADALGYAHSRGVVHRDIKPENILLVGGHAVVTDFGIARAIDAAGAGRLTETGLAVGTPAYMSPEQAAAEPVDGRSDLYALGCVLYEAIAGELPFSGPTAQVIAARRLTDTPRPLRETRETVPDGVDTVVRRLLARTPADRYATAAQFAAALREVEPVVQTPGSTVAVPARQWSVRRMAMAGLAAVALGLGALAVVTPRRPARVALDQDLLAVAPFDVLDPDLSLWREGLVDQISKNLDGAGNLRTSSPSTYLRGWNGRADRGSAEKLSRTTGAALVVYGDLVTVGTDSVRLRAALLDATSRAAPAEVEVRGPATQMGVLGDSLSVALLRVLGERRPVAAVRQSFLGGRPLAVLKEYLQGEQAYRRREYDSALVHYARAIAADSGFALAYRRMGMSLGFTPRTGGAFAPFETYHIKAAALNTGLSVRDSLLILGDFLAVSDAADHLTRWNAQLAVRQETVHRFPGDPEAWLAFGEFLAHSGQPLIAPTSALDAFERAIALDSGFAPAYEHVVDLALRAGAPERAVKFVGAFTRHVPAGARGEFVGPLRLTAAILGREGYPSAEGLQAADSATATDLFRASVEYFGRWPDSLETAVRLARRLLAGRVDFRGAPPWLADSSFRGTVLSMALAGRGHLGEAYAADPVFSLDLPDRWFDSYAGLALLGGVPAESASAAFGRALATEAMDSERPLRRALLWWLTRADTVSLTRFAARVDSAARGAVPEDRRAFLRDRGEARAYVALIRGDSSAALRQLLALGDSSCGGGRCRPAALVAARLLASFQRPREAAALLDRHFSYEMSPLDVLAVLERARVAETLGDRGRALSAYRFVLDAWRYGDPPVQAYVEEAREGLRRLGREGGR